MGGAWWSPAWRGGALLGRWRSGTRRGRQRGADSARTLTAAAPQTPRAAPPARPSLSYPALPPPSASEGNVQGPCQGGKSMTPPTPPCWSRAGLRSNQQKFRNGREARLASFVPQGLAPKTIPPAAFGHERPPLPFHYAAWVVAWARTSQAPAWKHQRVYACLHQGSQLPPLTCLSPTQLEQCSQPASTHHGHGHCGDPAP